MGLEPTTATLATWRSTTELHPPDALRGRARRPWPARPNYRVAAGEGEIKGTGRAATVARQRKLSALGFQTERR